MPQAALTIDDAPSGDLPAKLDLLEERDVPAVFFCEGQRLEEYPEAARAAIERGFHLGNHAYSHTHASELSVEEFRDEVERTEELIEAAYDAANVARPAPLFRFPYGDKGDENAVAFQDVLAEWGFVSPGRATITHEWYDEEHADDHDWFWTVSVEDWEAETVAELRENLEASAARLERDSADVILFHDAGNSIALFEGFLELLGDVGVEFRDPLDLV